MLEQGYLYLWHQFKQNKWRRIKCSSRYIICYNLSIIYVKVLDSSGKIEAIYWNSLVNSINVGDKAKLFGEVR